MKTTEYKFCSKFMFFGHNYTSGFITEVWKDDKSLSKHFVEKFSSLYSVYGTMTFFRWFMELSDNNKTKLFTWIENNYTP